MTRYDFGAIAEVIDLNSRGDVIVVTRDLSLSGCFVKTGSPLPAGTEVIIRISYAGSDFAATGSVTDNITREGMGIEFVEIAPEHQAIIEGWLGLSPQRADARGAQAQPIRVGNRLLRHERPRELPPEAQSHKHERPAPLAHQLLRSARNFWKFRDATRD